MLAAVAHNEGINYQPDDKLFGKQDEAKKVILFLRQEILLKWQDFSATTVAQSGSFNDMQRVDFGYNGIVKQRSERGFLKEYSRTGL